MLLFIIPTGRNWSTAILFQYISCYCLSFGLIPYLFFIDLFQYISCYCLSLLLVSILRQPWYISIHLMLLFICLHFHTKNNLWNFNTSHVTVYPYSTFFMKCTIIFQYISCYCLSISNTFFLSADSYFNTSHVTVYQIWAI